MIQFGQTSGFNLEIENFIMMGVWQYHRKSAKSYDLQIGPSYDG